jgi:tetratricopeptide (TPR) repeat protein
VKSWILVAAVVVAMHSPRGLYADSTSESVQRAVLRGDWTGAVSALDHEDLGTADANLRLLAAHAFLATNRNNEAFGLLVSVQSPQALKDWQAFTSHLVSAHTKAASAHYLYGDSLARSGRIDEAYEAFSRALDLDARCALAWVGRGLVGLMRGGDESRAYQDLTKATQVQPELAEAHASLGVYEILQGNAEGAKKAFDSALKLNPRFALAYNGRGCSEYGLGQPDDSSLDFEKARALLPSLVIADMNQSFVLAMVAKKVDQLVPPRARAGMAMTTLVIDIPGIRTQGEKRPDAWAPVLIGSDKYERFNIRHENMSGLQPEPGQTIAVPTTSDAVTRQNLVRPILQAIQEGKNVYVKIDQDIGLLKYLSPVDHGGAKERRWAAIVADSISVPASDKHPALGIYANCHSEGTLACAELNMSRYAGVALESPRMGADDIGRLARSNVKTPFLVATADGDYAHGIGPGMFSVREPNVTVVNIAYEIRKSPHTAVQDPASRVKAVQYGVGETRRAEAMLGDTVRNWRQSTAPYARATGGAPPSNQVLRQMTPEQRQQAIGKMVSRSGIEKATQILHSCQQEALADLESAHVRNDRSRHSINALNPAVVITGSLKIIRESENALKTLTVGISNAAKPPDLLSISLGIAQRQFEIMRQRQGDVADEAAQRSHSLALEVAWFSRAERELGRDSMRANPLPAAAPTDQSRLTGLRYASDGSPASWSHLLPLLEDVRNARTTAGSVAIIARDQTKAFAFQRMLENSGIPARSTAISTPAELNRFAAAIRPSAFVAFERTRTDDLLGLPTRACPGPTCPPPPCVVPPCSPGASQPVQAGVSPSALDSFVIWHPKASVGGVRTEDLGWAFVDTGAWPVTTVFSLAYETPTQKRGQSQ